MKSLKVFLFIVSLLISVAAISGAPPRVAADDTSAAQQKCYSELNKKKLPNALARKTLQQSKCDVALGGNCSIVDPLAEAGIGHAGDFDDVIIACVKPAGAGGGGAGGGSGSAQQSGGSKTPIGDQQYCDSQDGRDADPALCGTPCKGADNCSLTAKYINPIINKFLVPLAIIAVIIGIIWGAITYITSGGDPQRVALGKNRITKALLGLLAFIFLYAMLNWLIPGGLTSSPPPPTAPTDPGAKM